VSVRSAPVRPRGTRPGEESPRSHLPRTGDIPPTGAGGDVLFVDDNADARALYEALLIDDGHVVRTAKNGPEALAAVADREPDLVLLDLSMPGMDGMEVLRRLRAAKGGGPAVIILTAARREADDIERGLRTGADAYLMKPIERRELRARVRGALDVHRLRRTLEAYKRDQIAMLVHDLRHPLSSLRLIATLLEDEGQPPDERRHSVETIRRMCTDMSRLVDGVLMASRLEAAVFAVQKSPAEVAAVVEPCLLAFRPIATSRQVTLEWQGRGNVPVEIDIGKLRQVVDNLVGNAIKFASRGGRVCLRAWAAGERVILEVADDGPGVAPDERAEIFDPYRQGASGRASGGTGLGLAIARGIAEAHGGGIEVGASDLGGAAFRLWLPAMGALAAGSDGAREAVGRHAISKTKPGA
jgi:signal transduction histidine kinase